MHPLRSPRVGWAWLGPVLVAVLLFGVLAWPMRVLAGNPDLRWRTIETEHFFVHYYAGEEEVAERVAAVAERAYDDLSIAWGHRVFLKTHIRVIDSVDAANGRATAAPFPAITAHASAPGALSVLEAYDDWIDILITHELVHVIHLDTVHGLYRLINAVFGFGVLGKVTQPNIIQPRWVIEGIATMEESDETSHGRIRSAQFDMYLRMAAIEHRFQTLDQISSGARVWPHGTSVYLYGLHLMRYIADRYGADKLREMSHIYARQLVPFGINRAIKRVLGVDWYTLWDQFRADTRRRFRAQERRIRARGLRQGRRLTYSGERTRYPFWSADDRHILFHKDSGHWQAGIKRIAATGGRIREGRGIGREGVDMDVKRVVDVQGTAAGDIIGGGSDIVFSMRGIHEYRYTWDDLYRWRSAGGRGDPRKMERLTYGLRASEPDVSDDGRTVVFRRNDVAQSRLGFMDLATGDTVEVEPKSRLSQVYTPRWAPDGRRVAYSGFLEGGYRDIFIYDRDTGTTQRVTADRFLDLTPSWTPDGRYVIFVSDRDEVYNLYAYEVETGDLHQVSNVLGGAFEPRISHDGTRIAYIGFSSAGYDLWVMKLEPKRWLPALPATSDLPHVRDPKPPIKGEDRRPMSQKGKPYRAFRTFFPRTIFPTALDFASSGFGTDLGLATSIVDVLGWHSVVGAFRYLLTYRVPVGSVSYVFNRLLPQFSLGFGRAFDVRRTGFTHYDYEHQDTLQDGTPAESYEVTGYREEITRAEGAVALPVVRHPRHTVAASARYRFTRFSNLDAGDATVDPNAPAPVLPEVGDVAQIDLSMAYDNQQSDRFSPDPERGRRISVSVSVLDETLGGDFGDVQASSAWTERVRMPWRGHQVLALRLSGGASAGGLARRGAFFVGGLSETQDVIRNLITRTAFSTSGALRGYRPGAFRGRYFTTLNSEYRIPIADVDRGLGTLPFFLRRIAFHPFVDAGGAWSSTLSRDDINVGIGAALAIVFRVGYGDSISLMVQYAHGFDLQEGLDVFRAVVARTF